MHAQWRADLPGRQSGGFRVEEGQVKQNGVPIMEGKRQHHLIKGEVGERGAKYIQSGQRGRPGTRERVKPVCVLG